MALERTILIMGVVVMTLAMAAMAPADPSPHPGCAPHHIVTARLADSYGEIHRCTAAGAGNTTLDLFANASSGSWTLTMTPPRGLTCLVASGQSGALWAPAASRALAAPPPIDA